MGFRGLVKEGVVMHASEILNYKQTSNPRCYYLIIAYTRLYDTHPYYIPISTYLVLYTYGVPHSPILNNQIKKNIYNYRISNFPQLMVLFMRTFKHFKIL